MRAVARAGALAVDGRGAVAVGRRGEPAVCAQWPGQGPWLLTVAVRLPWGAAGNRRCARRGPRRARPLTVAVRLPWGAADSRRCARALRPSAVAVRRPLGGDGWA
ncbi:hypothetical protein GCM10009787_61360 [Streptomyces bangladeshensis]|uniref:Uncharacterized protein n=1 Tax=Streptomyces bangladeshensis TaxID=295352 RepID=A0ABN3C0E2_9ACTN